VFSYSTAVEGAVESARGALAAVAAAWVRSRPRRHLRPARREECLELSNGWRRKSNRPRGGSVMHVEQFEGLSDPDLIERFVVQARALAAPRSLGRGLTTKRSIKSGRLALQTARHASQSSPLACWTSCAQPFGKASRHSSRRAGRRCARGRDRTQAPQPRQSARQDSTAPSTAVSRKTPPAHRIPFSGGGC